MPIDLPTIREKYSSIIPGIQGMDDGSLADYLYDNYGAEQDVDRPTFEKSIGYQEDRFWPALPNSIEQGLLAFTRGLENNLYSAGLMSTDTFVDLDILRTAQNQRLAQERFNQEEQEFLRNLDEESEHLTYEETFLNALERPDLIGGLLVESLTATVPGMAVAAVGSAITAAATRNPDLATKVFWGLSGVAEGGLEYGAILGELFHEELGDQAGNPDAIRELLQDPEKMASFQSRAAAKGITVGGLNALLGFAGQRLATNLINKTRAAAKAKGDSGLKTLGKYAGIAGAEVGVQAVGESAIEALSQKAMGFEDINKFEVILEGMGGAVMSPVELGMGAWTAHRDNWKKSIATAEQEYSKATLAQRNIVKAGVAKGNLPQEEYENMTNQEVIDYAVTILNQIENDPYGRLSAEFLQRARSPGTVEAEIIKGQKGNKFWFELAQNKDTDLVAGEVFNAEDIVNIGGNPAVVGILGRPLDTSEGVLSPEVKSILDTFAAQGLIKREVASETGKETFKVTKRGALAGPRGARTFTAAEVSAYKDLGLGRMPGVKGSLEAGVMYAPENVRTFLFQAEAIDKYIKGDEKALDGVITKKGEKPALIALHKEKHEANKKILDDALEAAELAKTEAEQKAEAEAAEIEEQEWAAQQGMPTVDPQAEETRQREHMGDSAYEEQQAANAAVEETIRRGESSRKGWETRREQGWDKEETAERTQRKRESEGKFSKARQEELREAIQEVAKNNNMHARDLRNLWNQGLFVMPESVQEIIKNKKYLPGEKLAKILKRHKVKIEGKPTRAAQADAAFLLMEKEFAALQEVSRLSNRAIPSSGVDFAAASPEYAETVKAGGPFLSEPKQVVRKEGQWTEMMSPEEGGPSLQEVPESHRSIYYDLLDLNGNVMGYIRLRKDSLDDDSLYIQYFHVQVPYDSQLKSYRGENLIGSTGVRNIGRQLKKLHPESQVRGHRISGARAARGSRLREDASVIASIKDLAATPIDRPILQKFYDGGKETGLATLYQDWFKDGLGWLQENIDALRSGNRGPGQADLLGDNGAIEGGSRVEARLNVSTFKGISNFKRDKGAPRFKEDQEPIGAITVKGRGKGRPTFHAPYVVLNQVRFVVQQAAASDTFKSGTKNVHAWAEGNLERDSDPFTSEFNEEGEPVGDVVPIGYNPKTRTLFVDMRNGTPVKSAVRATIVGDRVYATGVEYYTQKELHNIGVKRLTELGIYIGSQEEINQLNIVNAIADRQLNVGDDITQSYSEAEKLEIIRWIQSLVGEDVTVRLENVNELLVDSLNKRRDAGLTNDSQTQILGYADPIEKVIVAALNPKYMNDVVGEEAFHIAQRLLLTDEELAILNDPAIDWVDIAEKNGIDLSAYMAEEHLLHPDDPNYAHNRDLQQKILTFEAQAKIAARVANGKSVKNFMGPVRRVMTTLIRNMRKLANFIRGKGWDAAVKTPQEIMLSFSRGEMSRRSKRMYPVGHSTSIDYDFAQIKRLEENFKNLTEGMASADMAHQMGALSAAWQFWFNHPTAVAVKNVFFQPIANLAFKWSHAQNELIADAYKNADTFIKLTTKGPNALKNRLAVENFIMALDFLGTETPKKRNGVYSSTIPNPEALDLEGKPVNQKLFDRREWFRDQLKRQGWKVGETLILNREQSQAYESFRKANDVLKQYYREAIVRFFLRDIEGLETAEIAAARGVYTERGLGNFILYKQTQEDAAKARQEKEAAKKIADQIQVLKNVRSLMHLMDANPNYAPRIRKPGSAIVVKHVAEDGKETVIDVSSHVIPELVKGKQKIPFVTGRAMNRMQQEAEYLKTIYPPDRYKIEIVEDFGIKDIDKLKQGIQEGTVNVIEALQSNMGLEGSDDINLILSALSDLITKKDFGAWIERQSQSITGHYRPGKFNEQTGQRMADEGWENQGSYLGPALNDYVQNMSFRIASTRFKPEIVEELQKLADSPKYSKQRAAHDYGTKWLEYVGDPRQKMSTLKSLAFHGFMGLNFSSAFLNLMQIPQALFPLLMAMAGGRVDHMWYIGVAFKDSMALIKRNGWKSLNTYGLNWEKPPKKWQNEDGTPNEEWLMLERLFAKGIAAPMNAQDLGAWLPPQFSSQKKLLRGVMDASGYFFGAAEFTNRMTSALSAYRMAKNDPAVLRRFGNYRKHTYFAEALTPEAERAEMTPEMAAEMAIMGSQYMMNKFNRPMVFHRLPGVGEFGPMESITQFMSFPWQYLEMWGTSFKMIKDKETRMMGLRMALLMAVTMAGLSGVMGMPFMENLRRIIRLLSGGDWDMEFEWKELMREAGVGELGEDVMFGGLPSIIPHFAIEGRYRFGQGSPVRDDILMGDFGAMLGPAYNFLSNSIGDLSQGIRSGKKWEIARALSPLAGVRNAFDTMTIMEEGMKTRNGTVHLTAADLTPANLLTKALGFSPAEYAARRNEASYAKYIGAKGDPVREIETQALTNDYIAYINARKDGNMDRARDAYTDFSESYLEYMQEYMENPEDMKPIHISTIEKRAMNAVFGPQSRYYFTSKVPTFRRPLLMTGDHALRAFRQD